MTSLLASHRPFYDFYQNFPTCFRLDESFQRLNSATGRSLYSAYGNTYIYIYIDRKATTTVEAAPTQCSQTCTHRLYGDTQLLNSAAENIQQLNSAAKLSKTNSTRNIRKSRQILFITRVAH